VSGVVSAALASDRPAAAESTAPLANNVPATILRIEFMFYAPDIPNEYHNIVIVS
jgi:hypothetical protein